jgi:hypothetical protein
MLSNNNQISLTETEEEENALPSQSSSTLSVRQSVSICFGLGILLALVHLLFNILIKTNATELVAETWPTYSASIWFGIATWALKDMS